MLQTNIKEHYPKIINQILTRSIYILKIRIKENINRSLKNKKVQD